MPSEAHFADPPQPGPPGWVDRSLVLAALAATARALARAADPEGLLAALTHGLVPGLGDVCLLYLQDPAGALRPVRPPPAATTVELQRLLTYEREQPGGLARYAAIAAQGEPFVVADAADATLVAAADNPDHLELLGAAGLRSLILAPLVGIAEAAGLLLVGSTDAGRRYSQSDRPLGEVLAALVQARREAQLVAERASTARSHLDDVLQAARELAHLLNNDLTMPVGAVELLLDRGGFSADVEEMLYAAAKDLAALETHVRTFQQLVRAHLVSTRPIPESPEGAG